jgi:hypothetical protein
MKSVGRAGLKVLAVTGSAGARGGGSVGSLEVGAVVGAARSARVKKAVRENIIGMRQTWVAEFSRPSFRWLASSGPSDE